MATGREQKCSCREQGGEDNYASAPQDGVLHPETPSDLGISHTSIRLITEVARQFIHDYETLAQW